MSHSVEIESVIRTAVDCGFCLHRDTGPGMLESVYEVLLAEALKERGLSVARQIIVPIKYNGIVVDAAFRADMLVEGKLLIELKATEKVALVHARQVLTYLRLMDLPIGLLMNFGLPTFKDGLQRIVNRYNQPVS